MFHFFAFYHCLRACSKSYIISMYEVLNQIHSPADLKKLDLSKLTTLASDIREALFNRLTKIGGHFGPNFGSVEAEIALHYVFNSPVDKFVFDVSHQSYAHKMLTGRKAGYIDDSRFFEDSGYTNPDESEHDLFNIGHTSTSISLATGLARARDLLHGKENVIAFIGDGSLSGGEALEGLDYAGSELNSNLIVIVNDNEMAIAETHGGIYNNLKELRETNGKASLNLFKAFGLDYVYEPNGNDIESLIRVFESVKDSTHPVVVHIHTQKGKGYKLAETDKETWHWHPPFDRETGKSTVNWGDGESYEELTSNYLVKKAKEDSKVLVISPAMPMSVGLGPDKRKQISPLQYTDCGIAEEQAIAMASGAAKRGAKPVVITNATFLQRTYDQMAQDTAVNGNPIAVILNFSAFNTLTDVTHLGIYINSIYGNIPNVRVLAPTNKAEYMAMIEYAINQNDHPTIVLIPGNGVIDDGRPAEKDYAQVKFRVEEQGSKVAIIALGDFYQRGEALARQVEKDLGFKPTLVNPRFASDIDCEALEALKANHQLVVTLEDGIVEGGFGEKVAAFYGDSSMKVKVYGLEKKFYDRYNPESLIESLGMTTEAMTDWIATTLRVSQ